MPVFGPNSDDLHMTRCLCQSVLPSILQVLLALGLVRFFRWRNLRAHVLIAASHAASLAILSAVAAGHPIATGCVKSGTGSAIVSHAAHVLSREL